MACRSNAQLVINSVKDCTVITLSHSAIKGSLPVNAIHRLHIHGVELVWPDMRDDFYQT